MAERHILVVSHTGREQSLDAAVQVCRQLIESGVIPVLKADEHADIVAKAPDLGPMSILGDPIQVGALELVIVLGGDGTILRAAEMARGSSAPLLGVNLGHVGFLAESERDNLAESVTRALARDYLVEERMTLSVRVKVDAEVVYETWALNEATVEKASRERMLEVVIEVDGRPLSSFGCDGVVMSTPTGSTAYAFSAGGPVVWPSLDAMLLIPLSPHALFGRALVVGPDSVFAVEVLDRTQGTGVLWCDGRRTWDLPTGARVIVRRSPIPVRLARLHQGPFTDRLVGKFGLPVDGWRGPVDGEAKRS
jgi:NAD+ kinase